MTINSKVETLGMPHGTARSKLVANLLFSLVQELDRDVCHVCNTKIKTLKEFSIEHIRPWEGVSADLFFDLNNIAFSHRKCNRPHRKVGGGGKNKILSPKGQSWCSTCKQHLSVESFSKNKSSWNGLAYYCKECHKQYLASKRR